MTSLAQSWPIYLRSITCKESILIAKSPKWNVDNHLLTVQRFYRGQVAYALWFAVARLWVACREDNLHNSLLFTSDCLFSWCFGANTDVESNCYWLLWLVLLGCTGLSAELISGRYERYPGHSLTKTARTCSEALDNFVHFTLNIWVDKAISPLTWAPLTIITTFRTTQQTSRKVCLVSLCKQVHNSIWKLECCQCSVKTWMLTLVKNKQKNKKNLVVPTPFKK